MEKNINDVESGLLDLGSPVLNIRSCGSYASDGRER